METKLWEVENLLSSVWIDLAEDFVDLGNASLRKNLSLFISLMHLRHPDNLKKYFHNHNKIIDLFEQAPIRTDGTPDVEAIEINGKIYEFDPDGWFEYRNWGKDERHLFFVNMIHSNAGFLARLLMKKRWSIITSDSNQFITTDKPVCMQHLTKQIFGFGTEGTIITFPLSQKRLLRMDDMHCEPANQYYPLDNTILGAYNYSLWTNCSRFMITGRPIAQVLTEIVEWADDYERQQKLPIF